MKKIIFLLISVPSIFNSFAQEEASFGFNKNDIIISGTLNYSTQNSLQKFNRPNTIVHENDFKSTKFIVTPEVGYFLSDHFMIGTKLGYIHSKNKNNSSSFENKENGFTTGLSGRYYFSPKKRISIFTELGATYDHIINKSESTEENIVIQTNKGKRESYSVAMSPGVNIFLNKNLSLTSKIGSIGYSKSEGTSNSNDNHSNSYKSDEFKAKIGLDNFYFGVLYRI